MKKGKVRPKTISEIAEETKFTLLTNICFAQQEGSKMRLDCHALLIEEDTFESFGEEGATRHELRGFGPDAAWPVFTYWLDKEKSLPYEISGRTSNNNIVMLSDDPEDSEKLVSKPIFSGYFLKFVDGLTFYLQSEDHTKPLDIYKQVGNITGVWEVLRQKVSEYWSAPYMPYLKYAPPFKGFKHDNWVRY